jgi:hypothetical protein
MTAGQSGCTQVCCASLLKFLQRLAVALAVRHRLQKSSRLRCTNELIPEAITAT